MSFSLYSPSSKKILEELTIKKGSIQSSLSRVLVYYNKSMNLWSLGIVIVFKFAFVTYFMILKYHRIPTCQSKTYKHRQNIIDP